MNNQDVQFWRNKAHYFEWLYKNQKEVCSKYRNLILNLRKSLKMQDEEQKEIEEKPQF